jgi:benzoyl-CoA reductase/2-hydroxyglutaryl-CoA dehydratase subunit BcrC/BadD/HgdB
MMLRYFQDQVSGLEAKLALGVKETNARKKFALEVARLGARLYSGEQDVAWCGFVVPFDLLHAMGVLSCFVEFSGSILAATGGVETILEEAESRGYSTDICSFHRAVRGAAQQGLMPEPSFLVATTAPCSGGLSTVEHLARTFKKDLFVINVPCGDDRRSVVYLADQLRSMTDFVAAHTHRPLDEDRLRRTLELVNQTRRVLVDVYDLARRVPTPARRNDLVNFAYIVALILGTENGMELARAYRDEFARKVEAGVAGVPGEQVRLLWFQNRIQFKNPLAQMLEEEFKAAVVVDELNQINWDPLDPDKPFESIAARMLASPLCCPFERRLDGLRRVARDYKIDGVIHPCHWGCRQGTGARGMIEEGLREEGIPVLNLEVDCLDPRNFSEGQVRTRVQAFLEMILNQKAKKG